MPRGIISRRKRGNAEGTIFQRKVGKHTYWVTRVSLPDGSRSKPKYFKTQAEANQSLHDLRQSITLGYTPTDITFTEWAMEWWKKIDVKDKTRKNYLNSINHLDKYVGRIKLDKLQPMNLEVAYRGLTDSGLSDSTVDTIHRTAKNLLRDAWKNGIITRDIGSLANAPTPKSPDKILLSDEDRDALIEATLDEPDGLLIEFILKTGMRPDVEALATTWEQIDWAVDEEGNPEFDKDGKLKTPCVTVGESKTKAGEGRKIPLEKELLERLKARQEKQKPLVNIKTGTPFNPNKLIFCNAEGNRHTLTNIHRRVWKRLKRDADIDPKTTLRDLRYNYGSYLYHKGVNIAQISVAMGHSKVSTTLDIYIGEMPMDWGELIEATATMGQSK